MDAITAAKHYAEYKKGPWMLPSTSNVNITVLKKKQLQVGTGEHIQDFRISARVQPFPSTCPSRQPPLLYTNKQDTKPNIQKHHCLSLSMKVLYIRNKCYQPTPKQFNAGHRIQLPCIYVTVRKSEEA